MVRRASTFGPADFVSMPRGDRLAGNSATLLRMVQLGGGYSLIILITAAAGGALVGVASVLLVADGRSDTVEYSRNIIRLVTTS